MHFAKGLGLLALGVSLTACATDRPHNDVLIFGTQTKLAADVSAPIMNGAIPEFTVGYKRNEGVWMPLAPGDVTRECAKNLLGIKTCTSTSPAAAADTPNEIITNLQACTNTVSGGSHDQTVKANAANLCLKVILSANKYVSYSSGIDEKSGGKDGEVDTYSVFASFGAEGGLGFNSASGKLAQFFATGIAAQRLGANPNIGYGLNAEAPAAVEQKAATEEAKAEAKSEAYLAGAAVGNQILSDVNRIVACRAPNTPTKADFDTFVDGAAAKIDAAQKRIVQTYKALPDEAAFKNNLQRFTSIRAAFLAQTAETCP